MMKMECTCSQKVHTAPVECIEVSAGASEKVAEILKDYNRIFMVTFDEKFAKTKGINVTFYQFLISFIAALVVVIGMRIMGTLLISSLIIFPAIISRKLTKSFKGMMIMACIISVICFVCGMTISFVLNFPTGASIVAVYILLLVISNTYEYVYK